MKALLANSFLATGLPQAYICFALVGEKMPKTTFAGYQVWIPHHPAVRMIMGLALIILGVFGFLPVLGFWMIPLGLVILSIDIPMIRRLRRKWTVRLGGWLKSRYPRVARSLGFSTGER